MRNEDAWPLYPWGLHLPQKKLGLGKQKKQDEEKWLEQPRTGCLEDPSQGVMEVSKFWLSHPNQAVSAAGVGFPK